MSSDMPIKEAIKFRFGEDLGFGQEFAHNNIVFQLRLDNEWICEFVSDNCCDILECFKDDFLGVISSLPVMDRCGEVECLFSDILSKARKGMDHFCFYSSLAKDSDAIVLYVDITVSKNSRDELCIYGQLSNISDTFRKEEHISMLQKVLNAGMAISGMVVYNYVVEGRVSVIPTVVADVMGISERIPDFPQWCINQGMIKAESVEEWKKLFSDIDNGKPRGSAVITMLAVDGKDFRKYKVEYLAEVGDDGKAVSAVVSHKDITDILMQDRFAMLDRISLMEAAKHSFPEMVIINATKNTYRMIQFYADTAATPANEGSFDDLLNIRRPYLDKDDCELFYSVFNRQNLLEKADEGIDKVGCIYRRRNKYNKWCWIESTAVLLNHHGEDDIVYVVLTRNVDDRMKQESELKDALRNSSARLEDLIYYVKLIQDNYPGLTYISYDDDRESPYIIGNLADRLGCGAKELAKATCYRIFNSDKNVLNDAKKAAMFDSSCNRAEYRIRTDKGDTVWVSNRFVRFVDKDGDRGYIHFILDVSYEHELTEQLRMHMESERQKMEDMFNVVAQHSSRMPYYYDISTNTARSIKKGNHHQDVIVSLLNSKDSPDENKFVVRSGHTALKQLFDDIHNGREHGETNIHLLNKGKPRWYNFRYTTIFEGKVPIGALISVIDVTDEHKREISHLRIVQSAQQNIGKRIGYLEVDLSLNMIEKHKGLKGVGVDAYVGQTYDNYIKNLEEIIVEFKEAQVSELFSSEFLIGKFNEGVRHLEHVWCVERPEGLMWISADLEMTKDPYSGHTKVFVTLLDVTSEQEEKLSVIKRADCDAMTNLLRKGAGEEKIRSIMSENRENGGILVVLDLDDMKSINDTYGHSHGDKALIGIATAMKNHFRNDDVLVRFGGDEFMIFLPEASKGIDSVKGAMSSLLRNVAGIPVGDNGERYIHCSAGCAVEEKGDSFEDLFKRADTALYHVKRHGKNNFAFYSDEMDSADYVFKADNANVKARLDENSRDAERNFIDAMSVQFEKIVMFNLAENYFRILKSEDESDYEKSNDIDAYLKDMLDKVHNNDKERLESDLSREGLFEAYNEDVTVKCVFRYRESPEEEYYGVEVNVNFRPNEKGDVCAYLFFRKCDNNDDRLRMLNKMMEISARTGCEYICLVDADTRTYKVYYKLSADSGDDLPSGVKYDDTTRYIADRQIVEDKSKYYNKACFDTVLMNMQELDSSYSYIYSLYEGHRREVTFNWLEDNKEQLLLVVRRL